MIDPSRKISLRFWAKTYEEAEVQAKNFLLIEQWEYEILDNGNSGEVTEVDKE